MKLWPTASADGSKIAFQSIKNLASGDRLYRGSIVTKSIGSGENDTLLQLADEGFLPQWSPDGSHVAFLKKKGGADEPLSG